MLFNSYDFLFFFLPAVLALYHLAPRGAQTGLLAGASYVFYGSWDWRFLPLLLASTAVDYACGLGLGRTGSRGARRLWLLLSLVTNLGLLGFFKYAGFFARSANALVGHELVAVFEVVLPVGISFYTFQSLSYTIDVYRGDVRPVRRFTDFACYVSLFCQLVAGPIVRFTQFQPQLETRRTSRAGTVEGLHLFTIGLAKKVIVADAVAVIADKAFTGGTPDFALAWCGALAYALQIYFDFSGYSDMAVGLGKLFGFQLPQNFDSPYRATSITDFWRRWHISLSTWLRDYLYIPLGGNRGGPLRTYFNLLVTMLLGGLWHGASWTFVAWGAFHGALLATERRFTGARHAPPPRGAARLARIALTFVLTLVGWVFFRSVDLDQAVRYLGAMFAPAGLALSSERLAEVPTSSVAMLVVGCAIVWLAPNTWRWRPAPRLAWAIPTAALLLVSIGVCLSGSYSPFLYFQF